MIRIGVKRAFIAQHYLIGGEWGAEGRVHSHPYVLELELAGMERDGHGFLVNIVEVEAALEDVLALYRDKVLNEQEGFEGKNPSLERFAQVLWEKFAHRLTAPALEWLSVRLWENEQAWAVYEAAV